MSNSKVVIGMSLLLLAGSGWAQETNPASEIAQQLQAEQMERAQRQARLDALMETIADEMQAIRNSKNREERDALMVPHRENMREAMALMRDMGGMRMREVMTEHLDPAVNPKSSSDRPAHLHKRPPPVRPRATISDSERLADLENRLDMMQVMMESMMDDQARR